MVRGFQLLSSALLVSEIAAAQNATSSSTCSQEQTDCDGNDLISVSGNSAEDCCTACQNHAGCGAAVFVSDWSTCYLKTKCVPKSGCGGSSCTTVKPGSGPSPPPSTCSQEQTDCDGNDLISVSGNSAADCCTACQNHAGCGAAVFVSDFNTCYLKTKCVPKSGCGGSSCTTVKPGSGPSPPPPTSRLGSFLVIGDWGHDPNTHGNCKSDRCQKTVAQSMDETMAQLGDVKFIVNVGDSFYPNGVSGKDDPQWDAKWRNVYSSQVRSIPWYSVYGNHDYHQDPGVCSDTVADGAQINGDVSDLNTFYMPDYSWHKAHPELQLEVVALELNNYQNGWNRGVPAANQRFADCQFTGCQGQCQDRIKKRSEDAFELFRQRSAESTAKNLVVFSHYPTDYFWDSSAGDASSDFLPLLRDSKHHIAYFGGHRHNVDQTTTISIAPNDNWLSGGGGGWSCDGSQQGFVVGEIAEDGTLSTRPVFVDQGQCCNVLGLNMTLV